MLWNYRVVFQEDKYEGKITNFKEPPFGIHVAYYHEGDNEPYSVTISPIVNADSIEELEDMLNKMKEALNKPVINYEDIK